jgi:hypothetical protein
MEEFNMKQAASRYPINSLKKERKKERKKETKLRGLSPRANHTVRVFGELSANFC